MGIRAAIKDYPAITTGATVVLIVVAISSIVMQVNDRGGLPGAPRKLYFTTDDGATYFADSVSLAPPLIRDGKTVLRAFVFKGGSGKPWVQYVGRYRPEAKARIEKMADEHKPAEAYPDALLQGLEVKAPLTGDTGWASFGSARGNAITEVRSPPGTPEPVQPAFP